MIYRQTVVSRHIRCYICPSDAEKPLAGTCHAPALDKLFRDKFHPVGRDSESDAACRSSAVCAASAQGRNSDQFGAQVDQRATAIAWIDRRTRLNQAGQHRRWPLSRLTGATIERAHDAEGCRLIQT